ncbi:methyltransferase domain-containing protein [Luteimicrobium subarcticum]|uniref:Methyltransferase family protein n=1 Tax=Luteimicrobium subarcticum TaxID=620910 RepID=A0A2M8WU61_9MICO|nr:methyltransferase domain-containing protein [Luteimicrobium subarcticum]PJI94485.1 methyltransferase family protein [Luteimicrobium subarcticum]
MAHAAAGHPHASRSFDDLVAEAAEVSVDGWDFSWLDGRATEERPAWGYRGLLAERLARARASLDLETGGGEVLGSADDFPPVAVATESWPPNAAVATALLHPRGVAVVATQERAPLPFADGAFDLVTSRHPVDPPWSEIARVLAPGGTYLAQHVGPASGFELIEWFLGPQPEARRGRHHDDEEAAARAAGLEVVDVRTQRLRIEIFDVGAVVYLLRKLVWWVPGFTVEAYGDRLRDLDALIRRDGVFVAHSSRTLFELRKPTPTA